MQSLKNSIAHDAPPEGLNPPVEALWWLAKGAFQTGPEWERAHQISQSREGDKAHDWVHALAHWIEGDDWNSQYWYRRAGEERRGATISEEWDALVAALSN